MNHEQFKSIALLQVALATATKCGTFDLLVRDAKHPDDINTFCDLVAAVAVPDKLVCDLANLTTTAPSLATALKSMLEAYNTPRACCVEAMEALEQAWPDYQRERGPLQAWTGLVAEKKGSSALDLRSN